MLCLLLPSSTLSVYSPAAVHPLLSSPSSRYCSETPTFKTHCATDDWGSFRLEGANASSWTSASRALVEFCRGCQRCTAISLSVKWADCSWFWSCETAEPFGPLHTLVDGRPSDFRTYWPAFARERRR